MNKIAAIDVDLCVVDIGTTWLDWLNNMTHKSLTLEDCNYDYDLGKYFKDDLKTYRMCPYDYFRQCGLYDTLKPFDGCVEALRWLKGQGYDIVFVSHIKGNHNKSKHNFLRRWFPFMDGYVATKEKYFVKHDLVIDDRNDHLNKYSSDAIKIKKTTPYSQFEKLEDDVYSIYRWDEFIPLIKGTL